MTEGGSERMALPYLDSEGWEEMQQFCRLFLSVESLNTFRELIASNTREDSVFRAKFERLSGLAVFLERYCSDEERHTFFSSTLKFIASSASSLRERLPKTGIPRLRAQENACLGLGRHLVVSLLASAFLCGLPEPREQRNGGDQQKDFPFSFANFYHRLCTETEKSGSMAAYLHCCLAYFSSLDKWRTSLNKTITLRRQGLPLGEVPSLRVWQACQLPLCAVSIENYGDPGNLLADIPTSHLSVEGVYMGDHTHHCMYPELLVSSLVLEPLQDNETLLIKGVERFVLSSEDSHDYVGKSGDLDPYGNFPTSLVAIDPAQFTDTLSPDQQYSTQHLLRQVNRAFTGCLCVHETGDKEAEETACRYVREDSEQVVYCNSRSSNLSHILPESSTAVAPAPRGFPDTIEISDSIAESLPVTNWSVVEAESVTKPSIQIDSLVSSIIKSGVEKAASGGRGETGSSEKRDWKMDNFANDLSGSILSSVLSEKPCQMVSEAKDTDTKPCDLQHTEEVTAQLVTTRTADILSRSIIADVLSADRTVPCPPPPTSPQTVGQSTSPAIEWRVHSYADKMADNILSSVFSGPEAPPVVVKKPIVGGQNSQSSSVTGQTITLHEFTDDLVEGVMREGLLIARLRARATERESNFVGCEGGKERGGMEVGGEAGNSVRGASGVAELLVSRSIQSVLEDARKSRREETVGERDKNGGPFSRVGGGASRRSESPMRSSLKPGLLRQTLERPKQPNGPHDSETHDIEQSTSSSLLHLAAPSSRMSYAWSVASTRDEGSRPVSPSDLDRMALSFVCSIEEYCSMFAELVIRGAIAQVTGNKKYTCHVPVKSYHSSRESLSAASGDLRMSVPSVHHPPSLGETEGESDTLTPSRLDTFLSTLSEAEPVSGDVEEGEGGFKLRSTAVDRALLRKVATGNWGCGELGGDPQLKSMLQWAAVSASGRSEMIYFPGQDQRMKELVNVTAHIRAKQWKVGQLVSALVDYCHLSSEDRNAKQLFSFLLHN